MPYGCSTILFEIAFNIGQQFFEGRHMIFVGNSQGQEFHSSGYLKFFK